MKGLVGILVALTFALYSVHGYVPLVLSGPAGELTISDGDEDIPKGYEKARLESSDPGTLWIIYDVVDYNSANLNQNARIVQGDTEVDLGSDILSAQPFDVMKPGAILFGYYGYGGKGYSITTSDPNLTANVPEGLSELIVTGGKWTLYTGYQYTGVPIRVDGKTQLGPGSYLMGAANNLAFSIYMVSPWFEL